MKRSFSPKNRFCQNISTWFWASFFTHFLGWNCFQRPLEIYLQVLRACSRYLKGLPNLLLCISKKIVTIRYTNKKILAKKTTKNLIFYNFSWQDCSDMISIFCFQKWKSFYCFYTVKVFCKRWYFQWNQFKSFGKVIWFQHQMHDRSDVLWQNMCLIVLKTKTRPQTQEDFLEHNELLFLQK